MADNASASKSEQSASGFLPALVLVVLVSAGAGFGYGWAFPPAQKDGAPAGGVVASAPPGSQTAGSPNTGEAGKPPKPAAEDGAEHVVPLEPILVNLAGSSRPWLRLEGSVAFVAPLEKDRHAVLSEMAQDMASYLRATSLGQLESAADLEFLREELSELVRLRSKGKARRFIMRALVTE